MRLIVFLFMLLISWACSKSGSIVSVNALVGTWRLTNYCKPTGNSTCAPVIVPSGKNVFITFDNDGKFNEYYDNTKPVEYSFLGCGSGSYKIEGSNVRIMALCMSSTDGKLILLMSVDATQLTLNPYGTGGFIFIRQ